MRIGAHISSAGGLSKIPCRAKEIGAECIQIFAGSPRRYDIFFPKQEEVEKYREEIQKNGTDPVYIHASYLLNLASEDSAILEKSLENLKKTMQFSFLIKADGVVYHPGSPKGKNKEEAIEREIVNIIKVLKETPEETFLVIENTAGKKKIGTNPDEIGYIFKKVNSPRLKVCVDTAHSFESGNIKDFNKKNLEEWISWWDNKVGVDNIALFHINDSLTDFESQHDRHGNIGEGFIGEKGFQEMATFKEIKNIPWILEVPGFDGKGPDKENVDILKKIRNFNKKML
ncbi:MAG: deoxyribonuclease IV [Candidatus Pacebacteria bacterium]|nr:deoxyribonuclease IV [Candidatus Paceibacterota bacterium]